MAVVNSKPKPYGLIYCVEHCATGRVYIGQTTGSLAKRWRSHQRENFCTLLYRAILKYGPESFLVAEIDTAESKDELDSSEVHYIVLFRSTERDFGFNLRSGGSFGKHSDESRAKMSKAVLAAYGRPETRRNLVASLTGKKHDPARVARVAAALTGKKATPEARASLSKARTALWANDQKRAAFIAAQNAGRADPLFKAGAAEKAKKQWADPEARARMLDAQAAGKAVFWADPVKRAARIAKRAATIESKRLAA